MPRLSILCGCLPDLPGLRGCREAFPHTDACRLLNTCLNGMLELDECADLLPLQLPAMPPL